VGLFNGERTSKSSEWAKERGADGRVFERIIIKEDNCAGV
jgi:hypothetical protein